MWPRGSRPQSLSLAAYFTGYENYAAHAAKLLRVWFLDFATRMNPGLNYAQVIGARSGQGCGNHRDTSVCSAGRCGRVTGRIACRVFARLPGNEAVARCLPARLRESANGRREDQEKNNHGRWYDAQVVSLALFLQKDSLAREVLEASKASESRYKSNPTESNRKNSGARAP